MAKTTKKAAGGKKPPAKKGAEKLHDALVRAFQKHADCGRLMIGPGGTTLEDFSETLQAEASK